MVHMLIVDDHLMVAEGLRKLLESESDALVDGIANTIDEGIMLAAQLQPQVLLLDIGMPDGDGIDAIPRFKEVSPATRIIAFTMYNEAAVIHRALNAHVHGFLLKSASARELTEAINTVMAGNIYVCESSQAMIDNLREVPPTLTSREREILRLIVDGLSQKEIANRLCLGFETVHSYTKYIRRKLGCPNTASLVRTAIEQHLV